MARIELNEDALDELLDGPDSEVARDMERRAIDVENTAKVLVSAHGTGRWYTQLIFTRKKGAPRGTPGRLGFYGSRPPHQASAPGMPPASDTGFLRASIGHAMVDDDGTQMVYAAAPYSDWLELGTRYMDPRPFLRPALREATKE